MSGRIEPVAERIFVGLGGNLGDPRRAMASAIRALSAAEGIEVVAVSSLYRTPPWGKTDQPDFLNAVAELRCLRQPRKLLELCLETERSLKRERRERWGPRVIDIDILAFGDRVLAEPGLAVPHPRLAERAFVLVPLAEIAGDFVVARRRVSDMLADIDTSGIAVETAGDAWLAEP
ncbi:MAG: 2-amino-4-hydroxy-6-hydroxymethyldihydropteridine diphosphokinase [Rhizobiaceae bacterium]